MEKYQSYKSSGVEWIGEIPENWNSGKMKYVLSNNDGGVWGSDVENKEEGTLVVRSTEITIDGNWDLSQILKRNLTDSEVSKCKLFEGDIVITKSSGSPQHIGKSVIVSKEIEDLNCCYSNFVQRIRFKDYHPRLYHYILNSEIVREQFKYLTTSSTGLGNLNGTSLNDVLLPFIPLSEQHKIVQFLDSKTDLIDRLISTKERKITLLKEQRTSLINQVVTKGLNPNVKMKDSGVEWIGEIPEHWNCVGTNKVYNDLGTGTTPTSDNEEYYSDEGHHWITTTDLNEGVMYDTITKITDKSIKDYPNLRLYPSGSIYISMYGGRIGKIGISTFESYCNQSVCVLPNNKLINVKFYYYWFLGFQDLVKNMGRGGGQPNINKEMIKQFPTVKIDLKEQYQIVEFLDSKTKEIDDLVQLEEKKIDLLKEYRQSLISEVVTGKIKVTTDD